KLPYQALRPQFQQQVDAFVQKVYSSLKPKMIGGTALNGLMLATLAQEYVSAINSSAVPTIQSAWTNVVTHQLRISLRDAVHVYRATMNENVMQKLPMSDEEVRAKHKQAKAAALQVFNGPKFDQGDSRYLDFRQELRNAVARLNEHVKVENKRVSERECHAVYKELHDRQVNSVRISYIEQKNFSSFTDLAEAWQQLISLYESTAVGPASSGLMLETIFPAMTDSVQKMWEDLSKENDKLKRQLQSKLAEADGRNTAVQEMIAREREQHTDDFAQERKKWTERVVELESMLEEAKQALEDTQYRFQRETAQMRDQESVMRDQVKQLQDRLQERSTSKGSSSSKGATGTEINNLRDAVYAALSELKSLDLDRKQLSVKAEHEKQLIGLERKFNKQLNEARRKNEVLIEHLRQTYEEEVDTLKSQRSELQQTVKEFEKQLAMRTAECDKLRSMVASAETDRKLRQQHADVLVNQSELIISFLRKLGHADDDARDVGGKLEKLSTQAQDFFGVTVRPGERR
ncbi:hypothetical protein FOZ62_011192, partial [Perkinsus olseni]